MTFSPATGQAGVDTSTYPLTTGTATWSVTGATVAADSTQFMVIATGPSLATPTVDYPVGNGVTTVNDSFWNVPLGANLIAPTLAIKTPSTNGSANVSTALVSLTGSATAATGKTVKAITWTNNRGGQGIALGTTSWSVDNIDLVSGNNVLTFTVRDSAGITASTTITLTSSGGDITAPRPRPT
ncbi:MAG: hypothetical protein IPP19_16515 [Verrucomicrobia bacterium]|nr:hypothetical protein [Verrucomicrobiota bacterium]